MSEKDLKLNRCFNCKEDFIHIIIIILCISIPLVIKAHDIDAGLNSNLHYDIVETMPRRYFHIDSMTGAIKTVMLLDHEKIPLFTFHVKVTICSFFAYIIQCLSVIS